MVYLIIERASNLLFHEPILLTLSCGWTRTTPMGAFNSVNSDTGNQSGQNSDRPGEETDTEFEDTHSEIVTTRSEARMPSSVEGRNLRAEGEGVTLCW